MTVNVKLPAGLVQQAQYAVEVAQRSLPQQIEHWCRIGKQVEDNPDLPLCVIRDILAADQTPVAGEYLFS
jgi:hypothetical protein